VSFTYVVANSNNTQLGMPYPGSQFQMTAVGADASGMFWKRKESIFLEL
jgi:hypothetical protein